MMRAEEESPEELTPGEAGVHASALIVGVGNLLMGDEGFGVQAASELHSLPGVLTPEVEVLDAGVCLLDALPLLRSRRRVVLIDAVRAGGEPGTIYRFDLPERLESEGDQPLPASLHGWGVIDTLRAASRMGLKLPRITVIGAEPGRITPGTSLSKPLLRAKRRVIMLALEEARRETPTPAATRS